MADKKIRNPIALAFGLLIQQKRQDARVSSEEMAGGRGLDVGKSTIRLFEVAKTLIPIDRIEKLHDFVPDFNFQKLSSLLVAMHYLHDCGNFQELKAKIDALSECDPLFKQLIQVFAPVMRILDENFDDGLGAMTRLLQSNQVVESMEIYLLSSATSSEESDLPAAYSRRIVKTLASIPSYDSDDVLNYLADRARKPLLITSNTAVEWEKQNYSEIAVIYGITEKYSAVTRMENIELFDKEYIEYILRGTRMEIIYLDGGPAQDEITVSNEFFGNLEAVLSQRKDRRLAEVAGKRGNIVFKRGQIDNMINTILKADITDQEFQFKNFWAYKLKDGHLIGFCATDQDGSYKYLGISPSQAQLKRKVANFTNIWNAL